MNHLAESGCLSEFARFCLMGSVKGVQEKLDEAMMSSSSSVSSSASPAVEEGVPPPVLIELLEKRETALRLSPLMIIVSMGKNVAMPALAKFQIQVAKLLLQYGARPDAGDVCGKTVCHYGMGAMATDMTLQVVSFCMDAYPSSHLFGKRVELCGLKQAAKNGLQGYCKGYVADTGRRMVYLIETKETIAVKPENLKLVVLESSSPLEGNDKATSSSTNTTAKLCDIPDRLGAVCLHEILMTDREDVAKILLKKYDANLDIQDCDGMTPRTMAIAGGASSSVANMVNKAAAGQRRQERGVESRTCSHCGKVEDRDLMKCSRCQSVQYCSKDCQKEHWKKGGHKEACNELSASKEKGVLIPKPPTDGMFHSTVNFRSGIQGPPMRDGDGYRKPSNVRVGEQFYIKVQGGGPQMPLMIYDKSRECSFSVNPGTPGFEELRKAVNAEPTWQGRKTYVTASFDNQGRCTVYPGITSIKKW